jgi:hypothetical protein
MRPFPFFHIVRVASAFDPLRLFCGVAFDLARQGF